MAVMGRLEVKLVYPRNCGHQLKWNWNTTPREKQSTGLSKFLNEKLCKPSAKRGIQLSAEERVFFSQTQHGVFSLQVEGSTVEFCSSSRSWDLLAFPGRAEFYFILCYVLNMSDTYLCSSMHLLATQPQGPSFSPST